MDQMLHGVVTSGTGRGANLPDHYVAGKTGTSAEYHDAWFVGYTEGLTGTVWVGNDDLTPMNRITGGTIPAAIWKQVMATTLAAEPAPAPPAGQTPIAMASNDDGLRLSEKEFPVALADFEQEDRVLEDDQYDMTAPRVETR